MHVYTHTILLFKIFCPSQPHIAGFLVYMLHFIGQMLTQMKDNAVEYTVTI